MAAAKPLVANGALEPARAAAERGRAPPTPLERWLVKAVLFQDTLVGRDKAMRLVQYLSRCLSGVTGVAAFVDITYALAVSRKTLRFGRQLKWGDNMAKCWAGEKDAFDRLTTLAELASYYIYCCVDHFCFFQRVKVLRITPHVSDLLDRFSEFFWFTEVVAVLLRELRAWQSGGGHEPGSEAWLARRAGAKVQLFKAACDLPCSFYFMMPAMWRNKRLHKAWCGFLGVVTSAISVRANWPGDACLKA